MAFSAFCLAASGVYCINDLLDADRDAQHPDKRRRPIASGIISPGQAAFAAALAWIGAMSIGLLVSAGVAATIAAYIAVNVVYTRRLKNLAIVDVFALSSGYVLRVIAGAVAVDVEPTPWILVVTFFLSLVLGFGKRRSELVAFREHALSYRAALADYSPALLDALIVVSVASTIISYAIYAVDASSGMGGISLVLTVPFVVFGLFRYLYVLLASGNAENPTKLLFTDRSLQGSVLGWLVVAVISMYIGR